MHSIKCQIKDEQMPHECSFPNCEMTKDIMNSTEDGWYIRSLVPSTSNFKKMEPVSERSDDVEEPRSMDWRDSTPDDLRNTMVNRIVNAIFPFNDPVMMQDARMRNIITYAKGEENDLFIEAKSSSDYHRLVDMRIYRIEQEWKGMQEKCKERQERKEELQLEFNAIHADETKDWHNISMTKCLRNHFVVTLFEAIVPGLNLTSKPIPFNDPRMKDFLSYAKTVELDIYRMAGSISEYSRLVTDAMAKVQDDFEATLKIRSD